MHIALDVQGLPTTSLSKASKSKRKWGQIMFYNTSTGDLCIDTMVIETNMHSLLIFTRSRCSVIAQHELKLQSELLSYTKLSHPDIQKRKLKWLFLLWQGDLASMPISFSSLKPMKVCLSLNGIPQGSSAFPIYVRGADCFGQRGSFWAVVWKVWLQNIVAVSAGVFAP